MEPGTGSAGLTGLDRASLEAVLDVLPTPMAIVEAGSGSVTFANRAANRLTGAPFPTGSPQGRGSSDDYYAVDEHGRPIAAENLPSARAGRGEPIDTVEVEWHTPAGWRSLLVNGAQLPNGVTILSFDDVTALKQAERDRRRSHALLDALFEGAPIGLGFFDRELRFRRVNERLAEINGLPVEAHVGKTVAEVLPEMDPRVSEELRRVLATSEPAVDVEFIGQTRASETPRHFSTSIYPVIDQEGAIEGVGVVVLDITERRQAEFARMRAHESERAAREDAEMAARRARFLAEASAMLDESLDYEATLRSVSRLAVPWIADWVAVDMTEPDRRLRRVTTTHVDPAKIDLAREWHERHPPNPAARSGAPHVARTGEAELHRVITDEMLQAGGRDRDHLDMLRALGMRSAMVVPMIARGRTLGVITFIAAETERAYGDDDLLLAEELARRAATSIDNARLYSERSHVARTLQASLLPPHLPDVPGLDLAARYRPVGEGNEVGGDFYDVFQLADDTWAVAIGDVSGKGPEAAALTALVRYTLRAVAEPGRPGSDVLRRVNDAMLRQHGDSRFSTVAYVTMRSAAGGVEATIANGGHPLPIVMRGNGDAAFAGRPGTLLGVVPDTRIHDDTVELQPGDTLVLYTDGVPEAGAPHVLLDDDELLATVQRCEARDAGGVAEYVEAVAVDIAGGDPNDDIAIVVARLRD